ncbi:dockerin type I repeat-containing protein [Chloroflexota bacterium]
MKDCRNITKHIISVSIISALLIMVYITPTLALDPPETEWDNTFGGSGDDDGRSVQQTSDGGYIIVGYTNSYGAGLRDVFLIKTDADGNREWDNTFGGSENDNGYSVQQTLDGGYIITGDTWSFGPGGKDIWLIKTDANGNAVWDKTFGGAGDDSGSSVIQTADWGYMIVGHTTSYGAGIYNAWLIKTDSEGNEEWNKTFGESEQTYGFSIYKTLDGGYIISGCTSSYGANFIDIWLIKTDASGNAVWNKTFGGVGDDRSWGGSNAVYQTSDGGYIVTGWLTEAPFPSPNADVWLIKTDTSGNEEWNKTFGGGDTDYGFSVCQSLDGGYIIAGMTESFGAGGKDIWLIKTDSDGNKEWDKTIGGTNDDYGYSVRQTTDGSYIVAGDTKSFGAGGKDIWLINVELPVILGDANGDGSINAQDITSVERIIVQLDTATPMADANQDGNINALDITKVERLVAGLD